MLTRARVVEHSLAPLRLASDQRGVSAVEFAMLLPLMLSLYLGGVEVSQGVARRPQGDDDGAHRRRPGVAR